MSDPSTPTPAEIIGLADECGYMKRRSEVSATLFFIETDPPHGMPPCRINIYYTTRSIMTYLNHPSAGSNELWRSNAYEDLDELRDFFENPRIHTGKGYRNANKAVRGCVKCGEMKKRTDFSKNQWTKGPDANKCKDCAAAARLAASGGGDEAVLDVSTELEWLKLEEEDYGGAKDAAPLTAEFLEEHDKKTVVIKDEMERRQFNCPDCPRYGRGSYLFFKKVPAFKPVIKCPQCKRASRGKCKRIYPVEKGAEKGYGLFKCDTCGDKWGSSRAVSGIAQECYTCLSKGNDGVMVKPFRLEVWKKKSYKSSMKRVPREPIQEDASVERDYGEADEVRYQSEGGNALVRGVGDSAGTSYDVEPRNDDSSQESYMTPDSSSRASRIPPGYQHHCSGCATGICKNRRVPKSEVHDSDGNTVSTRASVVTNSSIDKSDFIDRDEDFSGFEEGE